MTDATSQSAAHALVDASLVTSLTDHIDNLASAFATRENLDVDLSRVMIAHELSDAARTIENVAAARALVAGHPVRSVAGLAEVPMSTLYAQLPFVRSTMDVLKRANLSQVTRRATINGWTFTLAPKGKQ